MPFWQFFGWNVLGAIVWCTLVSYLGFVLGDQWEIVAIVAHQAGTWIAIIGIAGLIAAAPLWLLRHRLRAAPRAEP